jgi:predicted DNA-binding protein YlxM (UPF0122 family)
MRKGKHEGTLKISDEILYLFKKKGGGVYKVARKNDLEAPNLYDRIKRCDKAIDRIQKLLKLVNHGLSYQITDLGGPKKNQ